MVNFLSRYPGAKILVTAILALSCLTPLVARAAMMTFEEQYHYDAGEADSKLTCRAVSLLEVKKLLLERLGTYIESTSQVVDLQLTRDEVTSLSAGIVKTEIIDEQWDGKTYTLTARIEADPEGVAGILDEIAGGGRKQEEIDKLEKVNQEGLDKLNQLKEQMAAIQNDLVAVNRDYRHAAKLVDSWGAYEKGLDQMREEKFSEAVNSFSRAIASHPTTVNYLWRSRAYRKLKKNDLALADLKQVLELQPEMSEAYFQRGQILRQNGEKQQGLADIRKAARLGNGKAKLWLQAKGK